MEATNYLSVFGIALGLSLDAFAVAIVASSVLDALTGRHLFRLTFHFGLFQALMPVIGWAAGSFLSSSFGSWDHWIAFFLLFAIGLRAVKNSFGSEDTRSSNGDPTRGLTLVALAVATSVDALAVGFTFAFLGYSILIPVLIIGLVAACMTALGMFLGKRIGHVIGRRAELVGGLVLIGIGIKMVLENWLA